MKTIICGGRNEFLTSMDYEILDSFEITEVVHGGCRGIDAGAGEYARLRGIKEKVFKADWNRYGKSAGPRRNKEMADYAERCIAFVGGRGTANMINQARAAGLEVVEADK